MTLENKCELTGSAGHPSLLHRKENRETREAFDREERTRSITMSCVV